MGNQPSREENTDDPTAQAVLFDHTANCRFYRDADGHQYEKYLVDNHTGSEDFQNRYQYRVSSPSPFLVAAVYAKGRQNKFGCTSRNNYEVVTERIPQRLTTMNSLTGLQALYMVDRALKGFQQLYKSSGIVLVKDSMIGLDQKGEVKVWLNENFAVNVPQKQPISYQMLDEVDREAIMVDNILELVNSRTRRESLWGNFMEHKYARGKLNFVDGVELVGRFLYSNGIVLPKKFYSEEGAFRSSHLLTSMKKNDNIFESQRESIVEGLNRAPGMKESMIMDKSSHQKSASSLNPPFFHENSFSYSNSSLGNRQPLLQPYIQTKPSLQHSIKTSFMYSDRGQKEPSMYNQWIGHIKSRTDHQPPKTEQIVSQRSVSSGQRPGNLQGSNISQNIHLDSSSQFSKHNENNKKSSEEISSENKDEFQQLQRVGESQKVEERTTNELQSLIQQTENSQHKTFRIVNSNLTNIQKDSRIEEETDKQGPLESYLYIPSIQKLQNQKVEKISKIKQEGEVADNKQFTQKQQQIQRKKENTGKKVRRSRRFENKVSIDNEIQKKLVQEPMNEVKYLQRDYKCAQKNKKSEVKHFSQAKQQIKASSENPQEKPLDKLKKQKFMTNSNKMPQIKQSFQSREHTLQKKVLGSQSQLSLSKSSRGNSRDLKSILSYKDLRNLIKSTKTSERFDDIFQT